MSEATRSYSPPLLKQAAKKGLNALSHVLPDEVHQNLTNLLLDGYRKSLRGLLGMEVAYHRQFSTPEIAEKWQAIKDVLPYSLVGIGGLSATYDAVAEIEAKGLTGALVECGVARGGCAALIGKTSEAKGDGTRPLWLFDSFEGLPDPTEQDFKEGMTGTHARPLPKGSCLGRLEEVSQLLFKTFGLNKKNTRLVKGWFQDTLVSHKEEIGAISLLRLDGDWYESTKCCLEALFDNVVVGGFIIIDDYGTCWGSKRATDEFLKEHDLSVSLQFDGRGGALFRK